MTGEQRMALYRFYDANVKLLYVGITNDPWRRWREHVREQPWYPQVKHQAVTWYEYKFAAERAERAAIRTEHPRYNVAGADQPAEGGIPEEPAPGRELAQGSQPAPAAEPVLVPEPLPDPAPVPELGPAPVPQAAQAGWRADPLLADPRGRRAALIVASCAAWAFLPSFPGMPHDWNSPWMEALVASTVIPVLVVLLIALAPKIHRFGRWLESSFSPSAAREPWQ